MAVQTSPSGGLRRRVLAAALGIGAILAAQSAMGAPVRADTGPPTIRTHPMIPVSPAVTPSGPVNSSVTSISTTDNWSGYSRNGSQGAFTAVAGCWDVPSVSPSSALPAYSSAWIGIDGLQNSDLIQAGTEQDWSSSTGEAPFAADYFAWWEILPAPATPITTMPITPGDEMCASISEIGASGQWTISLTNETSGQSFTIVQSYTGQANSAEWIVEAPFAKDGSDSCGPCTLANYGLTTFSQLSEDGVDPELNSVNGLEMVQNGRVVSIPSSPDSDGNGFSLAYGSAQPLPPTDVPGGGYTLDAYGGVHNFGDAPPVTITGYWSGWQIATSIVMDPCDSTGQYSGWVMDGFGGLHPFAAGGTPMPAIPDITGYWPGWAIANDVAAFCITVGGVQHAAGCVLDGFGGLHPWADSSAVIGDVPCTGTGYWPNWDIATKITVIPGTDEGYVMDGFGGLHPFNGAPYYAPSGYWPGWTIARGIVATAGGGYTVDGFGGIHAFGNAPAITPGGYWPNWDIVRGIAMASGGTGAYTLDGFGGIHAAGGAPPFFPSGYFPNQAVVIEIVSTP
jgi:hypothetical protein